MNRERKAIRRLWTYAETKALLSCYARRKEEFTCFRRKRYAFENLVKDLKSLNVLASPVTHTLLENKMKSLLRTYKTAVDTNNSSGVSPCVKPFMQEMEDIFGTGVCAPGDTKHVVHAGSSFEETAIQSSDDLSDVSAPSPEPSSGVQSTDTRRQKNCSPTPENSSSVQTTDSRPQTHRSTESPGPSLSIQSSVIKRQNKKTLKERMFEKKLALLNEKEVNRMKRWEEKKEMFKMHQDQKMAEKRSRNEVKVKLIQDLIDKIKK